MIPKRNMFLQFVFLSLVLNLPSSVLSIPNDEQEEARRYVSDMFKHFLKSIMNDASLIHFDESDTGVLFQKEPKIEPKETDDLDSFFEGLKNNSYFIDFNNHIEKGSTAKGLTFNIYDDNMREAAIALFRLLKKLKGQDFTKVKEWARNTVNKDMYMYAVRLESLYSSKTMENELVSPFVWNPHYFINSEALAKASLIADDIRINGRIDEQFAKAEQYDYSTFKYTENFVTINTNYSGWNLPKNVKQDNLNYFREDVSLNSYNLGLHLLYPFWMSNEEIEFYNPRYAEYYYYSHQQLLARYNLEKLHQKKNQTASHPLDGWDYIPYLSYKNGLPFPTRSCIRGNHNWDNETILLKTIDDQIKECILKGQITMKNETMLSLTNHTDVHNIAKLIRTNVDGVTVTKIIKSIIGYGGSIYPINEYNPAPSVLHHPETSLRDPAHWFMLKRMQTYVNEHKDTFGPYDVSQYETAKFQIDKIFTKLVTYFDYYSFSVNYATSHFFRNTTDWPAYLTVKQRRLSHEPIFFNLLVDSKVMKNAIIRLYLGPDCGNKCWEEYYNFYEIDTFRYRLVVGLNVINWQPEVSDRFSYDNDEPIQRHRPGSNRFSVFRFPENLLIPRGLTEGLNLTLFVMITPVDSDGNIPIPSPTTTYENLLKKYDSKPLGFPFHRQAIGFVDNAPNYRFERICIYHKLGPIDKSDNFSPHLY